MASGRGRKHLRLRRGESFPEPSVRRRKTVAAIRGKPREGDPPIAAVAVPTRRAARRSASPALLPGGRGRLLLPPKECRAKHLPNPADLGKELRAAARIVPAPLQDHRARRRKHGTNPE